MTTKDLLIAALVAVGGIGIWAVTVGSLLLARPLEVPPSGGLRSIVARLTSMYGADWETASDREKRTTTVRNRRTGDELVTTVAQDGATLPLPAWIPRYPRASYQSVSAMRYTSRGTVMAVRSFRINTPDAGPKVIEFYRSAAPSLGLKAEVDTDDEGAYLQATGNGRTLRVAAIGPDIRLAIEEKH